MPTKAQILDKTGPKPVLNLTPTSTLEDVIAYRAALSEWVRKYDFYAAKSNVARLMAQGVVVSVEDEYDRAMRYQGAREMAKERHGCESPTHQQIQAVIDEWNATRTRKAAEVFLADIVITGHTSDEAHEWIRTHLPEGHHPSGRKCRHTDTATQRVYTARSSYLQWQCNKCGATVTIPPRPEPTPAAREALRILGPAGASECLWPSVLGRRFVPFAAAVAAHPSLMDTVTAAWGTPPSREAVVAALEPFARSYE